jgi:hypothetical protein
MLAVRQRVEKRLEWQAGTLAREQVWRLKEPIVAQVVLQVRGLVWDDSFDSQQYGDPDEQHQDTGLRSASVRD